MAADYESTAWSQVAGYYDQLYERTLSPVVGLNRAVAIAMLYGPKAGLWAVEELKDHRALQGYYLLPATLGYLHGLNGDRDAAASAYRDALNCPCNEIERRFLAGRLEALSEPIR
jgi:predicted RNA polymerase sigma factor